MNKLADSDSILCDPIKRSGGLLRLWVAVFGLLLIPLAQAQAVALDAKSAQFLGGSMTAFVETSEPLTLDQVIVLQQKGNLRAVESSVPKFGIGSQPIWLRLAVDNASKEAVQKHLLVENTWLDKLDVYLVQAGQTARKWQAGDADAALQHPLPGVGYVFDVSFPPGRSELYLRVETPDPLTLPIRLLTRDELDSVQRLYAYGYGLLYGFLFALIVYNAMLYLGLRERSYLDYSLYLGSFVLLNFAYTGHGYGLIWADFPLFQEYVILLMMVIVGCLGLRFASGFLNLRQHAPPLLRFANAFSLAGLSVVVLAMLLRQQAVAAIVAFVFILLFSLAMVWLGLVSVQHGQVAGRYFLVAVLMSMIGATVSALTVWVGLPYTQVGFHAAGWGVVAEGLLLALALAYQMRQVQRKRIIAEQMARLDPLTGLFNRRAFLDRAGPVWSTSQRNLRPLSVVMCDLDHFKSINDKHGHEMGDSALVAVSRVLAEACRSGDVVARWGGEEFILFLPETDAVQAMQLAERLRGEIGQLELAGENRGLAISASFGVATRDQQKSLDALIGEADKWLYEAKRAGRDRVRGMPAIATI